MPIRAQSPPSPAYWPRRLPPVPPPLPALLALPVRAGQPYFLSQGDTVQALAVDLMYYHPVVQEVTLRTAAMLCLALAFPPELGLRAIEVCTNM